MMVGDVARQRRRVTQICKQAVEEAKEGGTGGLEGGGTKEGVQEGTCAKAPVVAQMIWGGDTG